MRFELSIKIKVDPDANFLETFGDNSDVLRELIEGAITTRLTKNV
jgi:hypothetical protein